MLKCGSWKKIDWLMLMESAMFTILFWSMIIGPAYEY